MNFVSSEILNRLPKWVSKENVTFASFQSGKGNCGISFWSIIFENDSGEEATFHCDTLANLKFYLAAWKKENKPFPYSICD